MKDVVKNKKDIEMKREDIKSYAREKAQDRYCTNENRMQRYMIAQIHAYCDGFLDAVKWRIDSVWHDAKETPNERKFCLYILKDGAYGCGYYHKRDNTIFYEQFENVEKWAYFDDLIPFLED